MSADALHWTPYPGHHPGQPHAGTVYVSAEYGRLTAELYERRADEWDWSFYDPESYDPDLAVARGTEATREAAESALVDYMRGYLGLPELGPNGHPVNCRWCHGWGNTCQGGTPPREARA